MNSIIHSIRENQIPAEVPDRVIFIFFYQSLQIHTSAHVPQGIKISYNIITQQKTTHIESMVKKGTLSNQENMET